MSDEALPLPWRRSRPRAVYPAPAVPAAFDRDALAVELASRFDPRGRALIESGRPVLLAARSSGDDVQKMLDWLWRGRDKLANFGIDVTPLFARLDRAALATRFGVEATLLESHDSTGRPFRNRVLVVTDFLAEGLILWLSCGSARKLDESLAQPGIDHLINAVVLPYRPAVTFAVELSRVGRKAYTLAKLFEAFKLVSHDLGELVFAGDDVLGIYQADTWLEGRMLDEARRYEAEVQIFERRSDNGRVPYLGQRMIGGQVDFSANASAWPGTASAFVRREGLRRLVRVLYLDTEGCRPDPDRVRKTDNPLGDRADRPTPDTTALVCWFFDHIFTPGWDIPACAAYLREHRFATEGLRRRHGDKWATFAAPTDTKTRDSVDRRVVRPILQHLDEYRTGTFLVHLPGHAGAHQIHDVLPPRGYWLTARDYARITAELSKPARRATGNKPHVFSGLKLTCNGQPARLKFDNLGGLPHYRIEFAHRQRTAERTRALPTPPLPHRLWVGALGDALREALDVALPRLVPPDTRGRDLRRDIAAARDDLTRLERIRSNLDRQIDLLLARGVEAPPDPYDEQLHHRYNDNAAALVRAGTRLARLEHELALLDAPERLGVADHDLVTLLRNLADPRSPDARALLRPALTDVVAVATHQNLSGLVWWSVDIAAVLLIHNDEGTFQLPVRLEYRAGRARGAAARLSHAVDQLRRGASLNDRQVLGSNACRWLPLLISCLGLRRDDQLRANSITDARLRRLSMRVTHPPLAQPATVAATGLPLLAGPPLSDTEIDRVAAETGEPAALLRRVRDLSRPTGGAQTPWLAQNSVPVAHAYREAAQRRGRCPATVFRNPATLLYGRFGNEWTRATDTLRLSPCARCGATSRIPLRLREATGSVCARCRTDRAGIDWPAAYDRYRYATG